MSRPAWMDGAVQALPIVLGYVPIGFAFGVLAQKAGLSSAHAVLMSAIVYAGSAQFVAVGLFAAGASPLSIVLTTFVVNLRHALMAAALAPHLQRWRKHELAVFAFELTDETFALHATRFASGRFGKLDTYALNVTSQLSWVLGSWLGSVAGQLVADVEPYGLDYALPALFVALLVLQVKGWRHVVVAAFSGVAAVALSLSDIGQWNVIVATVCGATVGVVMERWIKTRSS